MDIFWKILTAVLSAAIPVLTVYLCDLIHKAAVNIRNRMESEKAQECVWEIESAVTSAVRYVNQTFVDALKADPNVEFDLELQEEAFEEAYKTAVETISDAALNYLFDKFGDIREYLKVKIEEAVRDNKNR